MASKSKEGRDAIVAGKQRLAVANKWETSASEAVELARAQLKSAEAQLNSAKGEVNEAKSQLQKSEKKWEVICVDDGEDGKRAVSTSPEPGGEKRARQANANVAASLPFATFATSTTCVINQIVVEGAGSPYANGTYTRCLSSANLPHYFQLGRDHPIFRKRVLGVGLDVFIHRNKSCQSWYIDCFRNGRKMKDLYVSHMRGTTMRPPYSGWSQNVSGIFPPPRLRMLR